MDIVSATIIDQDEDNYTVKIIAPNGEEWELLIPVVTPSEVFEGDGPFGINFMTVGHCNE